MRQTVDLASSELVLRDGRRQSLGIGGGDCRRGRPYGGGADPDSVADAGLFLPWFVLCEAGGWRGLRAWMPGRRPWEVVRMVGLPAGTVAAVVAVSLGRVGGESYGGG